MKVAIAGYGVEGKASYGYWSKRADSVVIADQREEVADLPADADAILGVDAFDQLAEFDLIIRSPSIQPDRLPYGDKVWSATNEFFAQCPAPIIGVTGTKGKGTTSSLIASILQAAGRTVHLVGNIGNPALESLPSITSDDVVVYELSSFQLWDIKKSPYVAVVLMIETDHLDVHASFDDYLEAKQGIAAHQKPYDTIIYNAQNQWSQQIAAVSNAENRISYPFDLGDLAKSVNLPGQHNLENASAAVAAARQFTDDNKAIAKGLAAFTGLPHRLKFVREVAGVKYYDDSIATTPGSALAALRAFEEPKVIILGGFDKGADYTEIVEQCEATNTQVVAIGQTGAVIAELCAKLGAVCQRIEDGMDQAVAKAHEMASSGSVVILSPASSSFDQYKSYVDRGDQFIAAVEQLG